MSAYPSDIAFTPTVKAIQLAKGSRHAYVNIELGDGWQTAIEPELMEFIARLDMFYLGTANASGQPYIQYRGGSPGFLNVLDEKTLAFADFGGNKQYITLGNLQENPKAFIYLMDYTTSTRIKLWGTAKVIGDDKELIGKLTDPSYPGKVERAIVFTLAALDINCHQHIHKRYSLQQINPVIEKLEGRIAELEAEVKRLHSRSET